MPVAPESDTLVRLSQGTIGGASSGVRRGVQRCGVRAILNTLSDDRFCRELLDAGVLAKVQVCPNQAQLPALSGTCPLLACWLGNRCVWALWRSVPPYSCSSGIVTRVMRLSRERCGGLQAIGNSGLDSKADAELINMIGQIMGKLQAEKAEGRAK